MSTNGDGASSPFITTYNDGQPTSTWTNPTPQPTGALVSMISALDATMASNPEYTRPPLDLDNNPTATANALSVLFEALPSAMAIAIASKYNLRPATIAPQPTNVETQPTPQVLLVPSSTGEASSSSPASITSIPSSTTPSQTSAVPPSATTSLQPVSTSRPPASEDLQNRAIAGIVSGVIAAVVILLLLLIFLLRRRSQGKRPFEHKKIYPEVAWLYDPAPTPTGSIHNRQNSGEESLLRPRREEMEQVSRGGSPERAASQVTSPLLQPPRTVMMGGEIRALSAAGWQGGSTVRTVRRSSASGNAVERMSVPADFEEPHAM